MRIGLAVVVLALGAGATAVRLLDWQSDLTLWTAAVRVNPSSVRAHLNQQRAFAWAGDWTEAIDACLWLAQHPDRHPAVQSLVRSVCR